MVTPVPGPPSAHEMMSALEVRVEEEPVSLTQQVARPGIIELAFGEPDGGLLHPAVVDHACRRALAEQGRAMLAYGSNEGPGHLRSLLCDLVERHDGRRPGPRTVVATGGNSQALDLVLTRFASPGDVVFVELPTYSLGLRILADHDVETVPVPMDADGLLVDELADALGRARAGGLRPRLLYTVPTYHNPTGSCLTEERRLRLVELAAAEELLIVEDDAYRELWYERPPPPSLWALAPPGVVVRLGSFSKTLAPGLRAGWLTADADRAGRYAEAGVLESGGHMSNFSAFVVAELLAAGGYEEHVRSLRREYGHRRDALVAALRRELPAGCRFEVPGGGFFVRVALPAGACATGLLPTAEEHGVSFLPGTANQPSGGDDSLRLAFCYYRPEMLEEAAAKLGAAVEQYLRG